MIGQGGADLSLTAKVASVKRFSPADRAGLEKMDYVWTVNGKEVSYEKVLVTIKAKIDAFRFSR